MRLLMEDDSRGFDRRWLPMVGAGSSKAPCETTSGAILSTLDVADRTQAALLALRFGLVD